MHSEHGFNWINTIPFLNTFPNHLVMLTIVGVFLITIGFLASVKLRAYQGSVSGNESLVPDSKFGLRALFDYLAEALYGFVEGVLGEHDAPKYFPVIASLFILIFVSNAVGLVPGLLPPTDNFNTTLALALFVFLYYNYQGLKTNGLGYLKHFCGPVILLAPLMVVIEIFSHLARPLSLALRLRGNMLGDHAVLGVFLSITPYFIPVVFYLLGLFVSFVQAYVFCLLSMIYIALATSHDH